MGKSKTPKIHKWTKYKDGYKSNMTEKEMNAYQERTGKSINPPRKKFSLM